jgi:glucose-1-phosphate thymidylyltransferase
LLGYELCGLLEVFQRQEESADALLLVQPVHPVGRRVGHVEGASRRAAPVDGRGFAMAGVQIFGRGFLALADDYIRSDRPVADLADLAADVARSSAQVSVRSVEGWRRFDGDPNVLLDMNRLILEGLDARDRDPAPDSRVEGRVSIHHSARIASSLIRGPVVVGANARVENAFVGPYTAIGDGARIEGAEIENSIIFPGAVVSHVAERLESCVIGRNARVERRFAVPRAMRVHLGDSASVQLH